MRRRHYRRIAPAVAVALLCALAGCGGAGSIAAPAVPAPAGVATTADPTGAYVALRTAAAHTPDVARALAASAVGSTRSPGVDSVAAGLHARLVQLFTEHVHLTGLAVATTLRAGGEDEHSRAAVQALDANAVTLAETLGGHSSGDEQRAFLTRWRGWVADLHGSATEHDPEALAGTTRRLQRHPRALAELLATLTKGEVPAATATDALRRLHEAQLAAVAALRNSDDSAFRRIDTAARGVLPLAALLATGLDRAAGLDGDAGSTVARVRAEFTGLLTAQLFQTRMAHYVAATHEDGPTGPAAVAAARAIGDTTTRLGEVVGRHAPPARHPFDRAWSDLVAHLQAFADAVRADDDAARKNVLAGLQADPATVARVLAAAQRAPASAALERAVDRHVGLLTTAMAAPIR